MPTLPRALPLLVAVLFPTLAANAAWSAEQLIPIEHFTKRDAVSKLRLSPDGKHLAVTVQVPQGERMVPTIGIYSLPEMQLVGTLRLRIFEVPMSYFWLNNRRLVMRKGEEQGSLEKPMSTGEILAFDLDGNKQEYLYGYEMFRSSSRGQYQDDYGYAYINTIPRPRTGHVFLSAQDWDRDRSMLYDVDSKQGVRKLIANIAAPRLSYILQNNQVPRFAYGWNDELAPILYRYDDASSEWRLHAMQKGRNFIPFQFTPDDSAFFAFQNNDNGPHSLIRQELASGKQTTLAQDAVGDVSTAMLAPDDTPFAVVIEIGRPRTVYVDPASDSARLHQQLSASFPDDHVQFINFTDDGATLLFSVSNDRDPGSYYLYHKASNKADLLYATMADIDPEQMAPRRPIAFKARDGLDLHGYLTMPKHAPGVKLPLVVMPHGGPHGIADTWYFDSDAQFLASRGYAVLQVNYRGSDGRGERFRRAGYRQWGTLIQDDILDGLAAVLAQGEVDASRVCSYGASFGAYAAMMLPIRAPGSFKCAIGYAGAYELKLLRDAPITRRLRYVRREFQDYVGEDTRELDAISPSQQAQRIKVPVLLIHGDKDETTPPVHAELMRKALIAANNAPEWMMVEDEGHGFYKTRNATAMYRKLEAFLHQHIGKP
ncbi:S9 family peptidase [Janthinobacterium lividum]|uniref:alpha/beta hydrolase family protein n=1 Tax=Janthinobacterium lividum TaxID=29581 RepID=UPI001595C912|nr:prolyl oligopeptidase family serine peptidase [Janthinobacterium lividum]QKY04488.1 S9 family peptidase [Janthinobacterium lividum]